ncbi:unnamed protein product, partial [Mesorhabditis belari]|uniref:Uncharacterized protein n=1 Tax=Mesorhabditis belari TaxID=2138241 RepID=A0AAF3EZW3_9BILA
MAAKEMRPEDITDTDRALIEQLRQRIKHELELVPAYDDDLSLLRWIVGWDRKIDVVVPKIRFSLRAIHALGFNRIDFETLDKVNEYCDSVSKPLQYLPGSVVGFDKNDNVLVIQMIGRCDATGLMPCTRNSDLYLMRIAESEGVMDVIRRKEKELGKQVGTCVIFDLDGVNMGQFDTGALKVITTMLSQLQEMFPDVIRHIYIVNAPSFIQMLWNLISPCLAAQTKQKIEFLGNNWKERLRDSIGAENLFRHWGGDKEHENEYGTVRTGGKVPESLKYNSANDLPAEKLTKLSVPARSTVFVPVTVYGVNPNRKIRWWWRLESNDVIFSINLSNNKDGDVLAEHESDTMIWPKFKLQTEFVPECGEVIASAPGIYKLIFDNTYGKLWGKTIRYNVQVIEEDNQ